MRKALGKILTISRLNYEKNRFEVVKRGYRALYSWMESETPKWGLEGKHQFQDMVLAKFKSENPQYAHDTLVTQVEGYIYWSLETLKTLQCDEHGMNYYIGENCGDFEKNENDIWSVS